MAASTTEPFGATSIPIGSYSVTFDESTLDESFFGGQNGIVVAQQPQTHTFATYEASKNETLDPLITLNGSLIDVNSHFVVYALKNGLIRVLHRQSAMRALLRGHSGQVVTDISFFHDGDTLATVGNDASGQKSTLIVWRVYENQPEIGSERLLEITNLEFGGAPDLTMSRLIWHPFNPNQFWMTHSTATSKQVATLVETTRIQSKMVLHQDPKEKVSRQHAACQWHSPYCVMENALQLRQPDDAGNDGQLVDLCWSGRDARHVLSVHKDGSIILWDLKEKTGSPDSTDDLNESEDVDTGDSTILPKKLFSLKEAGVEHSRCMFLPHEQAVAHKDNENLESITTCFVTASDTNSKITLWSAFGQKKTTDLYGPRQTVTPTKLQEISFGGNPSSFVLDICYGPTNLNKNPPSSYLMMGSRDTGRLYALHVKAEWSSEKADVPLCSGIDFLAPFSLKHPVYSWSVVCGPTEDVAEEDDFALSGSGFDIKTFAYQSKAVQCLTVTSSMSLPPKTTRSNTDLFSAEELSGPYIAGIHEPEYEEEEFEEDEYDVDDAEDEAADASTTAAPPAAPANGGGLFPGAANPFANWLGAIAGGSSAPNPTEKTTNDDSEDIPTPPAPSDLPMPPGIAPVVPPPGIVPAASRVPANENDAAFLNPLELLAKSMGTGDGSDAKTDAPKEKKKSSKSPRRSRSPKQGKKGNNNKNNSKSNKTPFPDGNVMILKRASATPPPLPADPSVLSDPALLAAAGIPVPTPAPVVAQTIDPVMLEEQVQKAVEAAMSDVVVPAVRKSVQESFATLARPLHKSMDALSKNGVSVDSDDLKEALDVETPLQAAFADSLKNLLVPSLQSIAGQVLQQVQASMPKPQPPKDDSKLLAALVQQLQAMTSKMDALTAEVQGLRRTVSEQAAVVAATAHQKASTSGGNPAQNSNSDANNELQIRNLIDVLLSNEKYEEAFTKAVATTTPHMAVYCCARSDLRKVLTDGVLSQPILICLMQHLSAALASSQSPRELQIELAWLQEITLTLNPTDPSIVQHVPKVLRQLVSNVNARLQLEGSGQFRRPLQMLLNSLMGMQLQLGN
mmetsp:Transcript_660/g.1513  ORF Transcript_660/g.1513 Transcript_660/m.1513 type:complete len:1077 (-) Transcript_660:183-3413(-)